jgi:alginate O-acetyltransferase complex protein AlgI
MLFPTIEFLLFFAFVFPVTWLLNDRNTLKKAFLVLMSYAFYACWNWRFTFLLFFSSTGNYLAGRLLAANASPSRRRLITWAAVALNLLLLAYFKYFDFLAAEMMNLAGFFGLDLDIASNGIALPVAISFLTFHAISYIVDVAKGRVEASKSLLDVVLYMAFFPHLVAGPIVRAADFLGQLAKKSDPEHIEIEKSLFLILGGLFKKVVIASHIATLFVDPVFVNPSDFGRVDLILAAYAYAIVIYCDFSAYTDIAIGVANLLGYQFPQNFNQPYRATSLRDFWRRWHMSLSSWLRDYLYIPMGGDRHGRWATYRNLMITMLLGGLWHGAGMQFIVWGGIHGAWLALERFLKEAFGFDSSKGSFPLRLFGWFVTFHVVCAAWIFFRSPSSSAALDYFGLILRDSGAPSTATPFVISLMLLGFVTQLTRPERYESLARWYGDASLPMKVAVPSLTILSIGIFGPTGVAPFIYFQF